MSTRHAVALALLVFVTVGVVACSGSSDQSAEAPTTEVQPFDCPKQTSGDRVVTIFHETHTHGRLAGTHEREHNVPFARFVGLRNALRDCLAQPAHSLFVGNGDDLSIDLNGVVTEGEHTIAAFNAAGIDVDTFGFSEIELLGVLRERVAASQFTWASANVREPDDPDKVYAFDEGARPWVIKDIAGVQVGITGLLGPKFSPDYPPILPPNVQGLVRVLDSVKAMRTAVPAMRAAGAEIIVLLSHMIHEDTLRVVRSVEGIDVVLGTHLGPPVDAERVNGTIVAVAGPDEMQALGQLDLIIRRGRIADFVWRRHVPSPTDPVDRMTESVVAKYLQR